MAELVFKFSGYQAVLDASLLAFAMAHGWTAEIQPTSWLPTDPQVSAVPNPVSYQDFARDKLAQWVTDSIFQFNTTVAAQAAADAAKAAVAQQIGGVALTLEVVEDE